MVEVQKICKTKADQQVCPSSLRVCDVGFYHVWILRDHVNLVTPAVRWTRVRSVLCRVCIQVQSGTVLKHLQPTCSMIIVLPPLSSKSELRSRSDSHFSEIWHFWKPPRHYHSVTACQPHAPQLVIDLFNGRQGHCKKKKKEKEKSNALELIYSCSC